MESNLVELEHPTLHRRVCRLMGNQFAISIVHEDDKYAEECIDKAIREIQRIEKLLTTFNDTSQTNEINREAGIRPVVVDREVFGIGPSFMPGEEFSARIEFGDLVFALRFVCWITNGDPDLLAILAETNTTQTDL